MEVNTNNTMSTYDVSMVENLPKDKEEEVVKFKMEKVQEDTEAYKLSLSKEAEQLLHNKDVKLQTAKCPELQNYVRELKAKNSLVNDYRHEVDPFGTIAGAARIEARINELQNPNGARNVKDLEEIEKKHVDEVINKLIDERKAAIDSETFEDRVRKNDEYKVAYDLYHSNKTVDPKDFADDNMRKAYEVYKNILDGNGVTIDDQKFLIAHNNTMYINAKFEYQKMCEQMFSKRI